MNKPHYFLPTWIKPSLETLETDLCIYGATSAGVIAAKTAVGRGLRVVLLQPGLFVGGMSSGGLGCTDFGKEHVIGGAARQFYRDLGAWYGLKEEEWMFEPKAASAVFERYLREAGVKVQTCQFLDRVEKEGARITRIRMLGGLSVRARYFMDATYEGDLLAKAGVGFHVGRESNAVHGETINGVQVRAHHQFTFPVDPYVVEGDPGSGTLPGVRQEEAAPDGSGDQMIQAYNFRMCMTDDPDLRIAWEKPDGYDDAEFELARRWFRHPQQGYNALLHFERDGDVVPPTKFDLLTAKTDAGFRKTDTNNHGPFSSDFIGRNWAWPQADYATREKIFQEHVTYQKGLYWFMANDPSVPENLRRAHRRFGLAGDEFVETGHWPHQLYVREARRMVSDYVLSEQDTQHRRHPEDSVGMGSYQMDSHNCQRFVRDGEVRNEGDVQLQPAGPYAISYRSLVPRKSECENLAVPVCISASHIAFGSVRMEPVFMVLAESATLAISLAAADNAPLQDVPYAKLLPLLREARQVLTLADIVPK
ncbi:MAG: FAD-dependent oxidoreductase [Verrucomicrobia bacterium]|nr:FAD-dependent oxidoreductase [Verrucomicrobiota bacterium]MCH8527563.1 FAD-dependent oxidoreductase [Kiritimatiellia bacterium]